MLPSLLTCQILTPYISTKEYEFIEYWMEIYLAHCHEKLSDKGYLIEIHNEDDKKVNSIHLYFKYNKHDKIDMYYYYKQKNLTLHWEIRVS